MANINYFGTDDKDIVQIGVTTDNYIARLKDGDDYFSIDGGTNKIYGDAGNDIIWVQSGTSFVDGGIGNDWLIGGTGDGAYYGGEGDDLINGGSGNERLDGGAGDDIITGGAGNDRIWAGSGTNLLTGGAGDDHFQLEGGNDTFFFVGNFGTDRIKMNGPDGDVGLTLTLGATGHIRVEGFTDIDQIDVLTPFPMKTSYEYNAGGDIVTIDTMPGSGVTEVTIQLANFHFLED